MDILTLQNHHAMQLAVLNQQMQEELFGEADTTLVMLEIRMKSFLASEGIAFGIEKAGLLVGFCLAEKTTEGVVVHSLFVSEGERRQGLATALVEKVYEHYGAGEISFPAVEESSIGELFYCSFE